MKNFRFALSGMVVLLYLLCSCSLEEPDIEKQVIEEVDEDDEAADEEGTPVTGEKEPDGEEEPPVTGEKEPDGEEEPPVTGEKEPDGEEEPPVTGEKEPDDGEETPEPSENTGKLALRINELRTEYSKPKAEFIEFKILSAGNLGGLRVFIASNYKNPLVYEFLPVEVKEGEYVVLHLRTLEESCRDEYGEDMDESGGTDSSPTARDFWVPGSTELLRENDAIYIMDQHDSVLDAVMFVKDTGAAAWPKPLSQDSLSPVAELLFNQGAWKSADGTIPVPSDAVSSAGIGSAITRSISRDETVEDTNTSADWYVTANNGATPGKENNPKRL